MASEVKYDVLENINPDLSDSEYVDVEVNQGLDAPTPGFDAATPAANADADEDEDEGAGAGAREEEDEAEGDIDEELAAELDLALGDEEGGGDDDDDEEDEDEEEESDEDDDDDDETVQARKLLNEEIQDLEAAVNKKRGEIANSANPLIKVCIFAHVVLSAMLMVYGQQRRFEDALKKLQADLDTKLAQRDEMKENARLRKQGIAPGGAAAGRNDADEFGGDDDDDLFGEGPNAMEIG